MTSDERLIFNAITERVYVPRSQERMVEPSGRESEWIFDFRRVSLSPDFLKAFTRVFWERFKDRAPFQVGGLEVAAIPLVSAIVMKSVEEKRPLNGFFIRKSRKKQGLMKALEGVVGDETIILVDDLINSGGSFIQQIELLEKMNKKVAAVFAILRYRDESYYGYFREKGIKLVSLFCLDDFKDILPVENLIKRNELPVPMPFEVKWYFKSDGANHFYVVPKSGPLLDEEHVYMGSDSGNFYAIERSTGKVVWRYKIPFGAEGKYIFSSPARSGELIYFGAYDGNLYALERKSGERAWVFMEADWIGSSPVVAPDIGLLYIGLEFGLIKKRGGVAAIDAKTGTKRWEYRMNGLTHATPAYSKKFGLVVSGCNNATFYGLDAKSGEKRWEVTLGAPSRYSAAFHEGLGLVFVGAEDGTLYAIEVKTGKIAYRFPVEFGMYSTPLVVGNKIYAAGLDKNVYCVDAASGKELWRFATGGRIFASPRYYLGKIYIGSNNGKLYELDPETGKNTALFQATERIVNAVACDEKTGEIFLSTFDNELYCIKKRGQQVRR